MTGRGLALKLLELIGVARDILTEIKPASVRSVCYQLFNRKLIANMSTGETQKVSRLLVIARETGAIPWEWIVDETRSTERYANWDDISEYGQAVVRGYRKNFWYHQDYKVEDWSEKGTVRGVLAPVLQRFAIPFSVKHGFDSATSVKQVADETEDLERPLITLYVGDWEPSGLWMSEKDLPERLHRYGAYVILKRIALNIDDIAGGDLPSFQASTKAKDPRHRWFIENYGPQCWELDALPPPVLRARVEEAVLEYIDAAAWNHCAKIEAAELKNLKDFN